MITNLIIGGAPKSGTSAVFKYLSDHKDISPSSIKETAFFIDKWIDNIDLCRKEYDKLFIGSHPHKIHLEASTGYLGYSDVVVPRAKKLLDDNAKFLFILREPVDRVYSYYWYRKGNNAFPDGMPFSEYLTACENYEKYGENIFNLDEYDLRILSHGKYSAHLKQFMNAFGEDAVLIMPYEKLSQNPFSFMCDVCKFIDIDPAIYLDYEFSRVNVSMSAKIDFIHNIAIFFNEKMEPILRRNPLVKDFLKRIYLLMNTEKIGYEEMSKDDRGRLAAYYKDSIYELSKYVDKGSFSWIDCK